MKKFSPAGLEFTGWNFQFDDAQEEDYARAFTIDSSAGVYVGGKMNGDWSIKKLERAGRYCWTQIK